MPLYRMDKSSVAPIKQTEFKLERDLQNIIESNLASIFGLKFICSEYQLNNLRIDTLAFDEASKSFVVIEYKRDKSSSVIDQGYSYLSLVVNNKADFVLEHNERTASSAHKADFDWRATRVIFVAAQFTVHQLGAINFQDLPIELWEAKMYEGQILSLEKRDADQRVESINMLATKDHGTKQESVTKEVKSYRVDDIFPNQYGAIRSLYDELEESIRALNEKTTIVPTKSYIGFRLGSDWRNIIAVGRTNTGMWIDFLRTQPSDLKDPEKKVTLRPTSKESYNQYISRMSVKNEEDLKYALFVCQQVYKTHVKKYGG